MLKSWFLIFQAKRPLVQQNWTSKNTINTSPQHGKDLTNEANEKIIFSVLCWRIDVLFCTSEIHLNVTINIFVINDIEDYYYVVKLNFFHVTDLITNLQFGTSVS